MSILFFTPVFSTGSQAADPQHGVRDDAADAGLCDPAAQERGEPLRQGVQEARRQVPHQGQEVPPRRHQGMEDQIAE